MSARRRFCNAQDLADARTHARWSKRRHRLSVRFYRDAIAKQIKRGGK